MFIPRRGVFGAFLVLAVVGTSAQTFPSKPIRVFVPFPAGGGTDVIARDVTNRLTQTLNWAFVIENKPGSGGNLGIDAVAKSPADGYTLALGQSSNLSVNPTLYSRMPYDSVKDLTPIALVASAPLVLVVAGMYRSVPSLRVGMNSDPNRLAG